MENGSYQAGHDTKTLTRFNKKHIPEPNSGCWLWEAAVSSEGYGQFYLEDKLRGAHVTSFILYKGPISEGMQVCHKCDTPLCVNPEHLFLGTKKDNMLDCISKGRRQDASGENNPFAKLSSNTVRAIYRAAGSQREIAKRFGISQSHVSRIKRQEVWVDAEAR